MITQVSDSEQPHREQNLLCAAAVCQAAIIAQNLAHKQSWHCNKAVYTAQLEGLQEDAGVQPLSKTSEATVAMYLL